METTEITKYGVTLALNKPLTDEAHVQALETQLGRRLPDGYREFLLSYNGGRPSPSAFRFITNRGKHEDSTVEWFLSLYDGKHSNLERNIEIFHERIPPDTMPIADDAFGNMVLISLHGDHRGKVYFWDHEEEPDSQPDWSNVSLVADSFDAFMRGLWTVEL